MGNKKTQTRIREKWLNEAIEAIRPFFTAKGYKVPVGIRISVGFPYRGQKATGQCFSPEVSADKSFEIFVSPVIADSPTVLTILVHEIVHTVVGTEAKHKKLFKQCAIAVGLEGKMTATHAGEKLTEQLRKISAKLGPYPHAELNPTKTEKKQTTRLIKVSCPECDYVARVTRVHLDEKGAPICPVCKVAFVEEITQTALIELKDGVWGNK